MPKVSLTANKGARLQRIGSTNRGAGKDHDAPVGYTSSTGAIERYVLAFPPLAASLKVRQIVKVELFLRNDTPHQLTRGGTPKVKVRRVTTAWTDGSASSPQTGNAVIFPGPTQAGTAVTSATLSGTNDKWNDGVDVTDMYCDGLATTIKRPDGSACGGLASTGFVLMNPGDDMSSTPSTGAMVVANDTEFWSQDATGTPPYLRVEYDDNNPPAAPTGPDGTGPVLITGDDFDQTPEGIVTSATGKTLTVEGRHSDPLDPGSYPIRARVQVFASSATDATADSGAASPINDVVWYAPAGTRTQKFKVRAGVSTPGFLDPPITLHRTVKVRARTIDQKNLAGAWGALQTVVLNARALATNIFVTPNTRTPDVYVSISDPDVALGGTAGKMTATLVEFWTQTAFGPVQMNPGASKSQPFTATLRAGPIAYSGGDLEWDRQYWAVVQVWDDSDVPSRRSAKVYFTPRQQLGPATMLPSGVETLQTTRAVPMTVGDTAPFDRVTMRFFRAQDSVQPFWSQTHAPQAYTLAAVPAGGRTNLKLTGVLVGGAIVVLVGDKVRVATPAGPTDDVTVTAVGTGGAGGTGLTVTPAVSVGHLVGGTVRVIQVGRVYAGPVGLPGIDWGGTYWWEAAVEPYGAAAYAATSQRIPFYVDAKPAAPGPFSVVDAVDSGKSYLAVASLTPTIHLPYNDPDVALGYTDARTSRILGIRDASASYAHIAGSPFTVGGVSEDYTVGGGLLTLEHVYWVSAADYDTAGQGGPFSPYGIVKVSAAPAVAAVNPAKGASLATSAAADDIIDTVAAHGFAAGQPVRFSALTGGTGLSLGTTYYVIAASLGATTFKIAATLGGAAINFTTDITAGAVVPVITDATVLVDWTFAGSGGKAQAKAQVIVTDATPSPDETVYDSGVVATSTSSLTVPPFQDDGETPLLKSGHYYVVSVQAWDTDNLSTVLTWAFVTEFSVPPAVTAVVAVPEPDMTAVFVWWAWIADPSRVEFRVFRRANGEFVRIDEGGLLDGSITDQEAPIGVNVDYFVTQHNGALESPLTGDSQDTTLVDQSRWWTKAPDGTLLRELHYVTDWSVSEQDGDTYLLPLPGDDDDERTMPVVLSGGDRGRVITLMLQVPRDEADEVAYLRDLRRAVSRGSIAYVVLQSPLGNVWRVKFGPIPEGKVQGGPGQRAVALVATEIA